MEEKVQDAVEVKEEVKEEQPKKLTYEQLEQVAVQVSNQNKELVQKLQEANLFNAFKRLDYLFNVLQYKDAFNAEFVAKCAAEIEASLTIQKTEEKPEEGVKEEAAKE